MANAAIENAGKPTTLASVPKYIADFMMNMPKLITMLLKRANKIRFRQQTYHVRNELARLAQAAAWRVRTI